ncbi:MAG: sugar nucleotide-binding protein, partial [Verrucomicrobiota bacterium]
MILLLGATGHVGQAFSNELRRRGQPFIPLTRSAIDYTQFEVLFDYVRKIKPSFLINAAGYTGRPNIDACEVERKDTLQANALFPQNVAKVCRITNTPWGHVSSASIYAGTKVLDNGRVRTQRDINDPETAQAVMDRPEDFFYFTEKDEPNFSFRHGPCNFYSGTKALAEETLRDFGDNYIWRPGVVFDEFDGPRNFLTKLQRC